MRSMSADDAILHPVVICQVMIHFAARHGVSLESCLLGTDIRPEQLQQADTLIHRQQEMRLVENLMLALPEPPALGFELGLQYSIATFGIWGFALRTSRTLYEALQHALRYLPLSTAYCRIDILESPQQLGIRLDPSGIPRHLRQWLLERDMATAITLLREISLSGIELQGLSFQVDGSAAEAARITELCGVAPQYSSADNALWIARSAADIPLPTYDAHLVRLLEDQCRLQLERRQHSGVAGQVRAQLLGRLGLVAGVDEVAKALHLSPRSLRRKLDAEGTSFRQLLEEERRQLAEQLLGNTQMTLDELAIHLGYADTAGFTRAFRRWHAFSPGEFRKRHPGNT